MSAALIAPAAGTAEPRHMARPRAVRLAAFRVQVALPGRSRHSYTGLFASGGDAVVQTLADYPEAQGVSALFLWRCA